MRVLFGVWVVILFVACEGSFGYGVQMQRVLALRKEYVKKMEELRDVEERTALVRAELEKSKAEKVRATNERHRAMKKRKDGDLALDDVAKRASEADFHIRSTREEMGKLEEAIQKLGIESENLRRRKDEIIDRMRKSGLRRWLAYRGRKVLPKTTYGVFSKSADLIDPLATKLKSAASRERLVVDHVGLRSPFLRGIVFYAFIIAPVVGILTFVLRCTEKLRRITKELAVVGCCTFFAGQSFLLFFLSTLLRSEVMTLLRWRKERLFIVLLFFWASLYLVFMAVFTLHLRSRPDLNTGFQLLAAGLVGYHFFEEAFRPAVLTEELRIKSVAYLIYSTVFLLVAVDKAKSAGIDLESWMKPHEEIPLTKKPPRSGPRLAATDGINEIRPRPRRTKGSRQRLAG